MSKTLVEIAKRVEVETGHYSGGPLNDFEVVDRHTFQPLLAAGLLPSHRVLDFG